MSKAAEAFFRAVGAPTPAAGKAAETVVEVERKRGGDRGSSERKKQAAEAAIKKLNKKARAARAELEEAYNNAEEGSEEQRDADIGWYRLQVQWAEAYKELAPDAGLELTEEDEAWIDDAPSALSDAYEKWGISEAVSPVDTEPPAKKVDKPEQGTPQTDESQPLSVRRQALIDEAEPWKAQAEEIDAKLQQIEHLRSTGEAGGVVGAQLIASEDDLKEERAGLSDLLETNRRSLQELGSETAGVAGRSAAPTGEGRREALGTLSWGQRWGDSPLDVVFPVPISKSIALERAGLGESPAGHLFAPKPVGGATPEALAELKRRRDAVETISKEREDELESLRPLITQLEEGMVPAMGGGRSHKDPLKQKALSTMIDRRSELLRLQEEDAPTLEQMVRGVSHMESVLSEQGQE